MRHIRRKANPSWTSFALIVAGLAVSSVLGQLGPFRSLLQLRGCWVTIIGYGQQGVSAFVSPSILVDFHALQSRSSITINVRSILFREREENERTGGRSHFWSPLPQNSVTKTDSYSFSFPLILDSILFLQTHRNDAVVLFFFFFSFNFVSLLFLFFETKLLLFTRQTGLVVGRTLYYYLDSSYLLLIFVTRILLAVYSLSPLAIVSLTYGLTLGFTPSQPSLAECTGGKG